MKIKSMTQARQLVALLALSLAACSADDTTTGNSVSLDATLETNDAGPVLDGASHDVDANLTPVYTHKMVKATGENRFSQLSYECNICTFEQISSIEAPEGWTFGPTQILIPLGEMRSRPSFEGVPDAVDFIDEVPGAEYKLIAKTLTAQIVEIGQNGIMVEAQVMRDTRLWFPARRRVHELTDPTGRTFILFAYDIDPMTLSVPDFEDPTALGDFRGPDGWTYTTRVVSEELVLDSSGTVSVLAIRGEVNSTWELRQ